MGALPLQCTLVSVVSGAFLRRPWGPGRGGPVTDCLCRDTRAAELCTKHAGLERRLADGLDSVQRRGGG
jgi:hypothetical protein